MSFIFSHTEEILLGNRQALGWPEWALSSKVELQLTVAAADASAPLVLIRPKLAPELIGLVLYWFLYSEEPSDELSRKSWKRQLGQLSLTCRHWAKICRPPLFRRLRLSCLEDLRQLHSWATKIEPLIAGVDVLYEESHIPWTHLLNLPSSSPFPRWRKSRMFWNQPLLQVDIEKALSIHPVHTRQFRSLHALLPRPIPSSYMHVQNLHLSNHHFSAFRDLMHLIWELPNLIHLYCRKLTWDAPAEPPRPPVYRGSRYLMHVEATDCPDLHHLLWVYTTLGSLVLGARRPSIVTLSELSYLAELVREFVVLWTALKKSESVSDNGPADTSEQWTLVNQAQTKCNEHIAVDPPQFGAPVKLKAHYALPNPHQGRDPSVDTSSSTPMIYHITRLTLCFKLEAIKLETEQWNLQKLDEQADHFPHLEQCEMIMSMYEHQWSSEEFKKKCTAAAREIRSQMPKMRDLGRLRFIKQDVLGERSETLDFDD